MILNKLNKIEDILERELTVNEVELISKLEKHKSKPDGLYTFLYLVKQSELEVSKVIMAYLLAGQERGML